jgi:SAM-dependent methyltransferase
MNSPHKIMEENNRFFSEVIDDYKVSYLRQDEIYLIDHYFHGKVLILGCGAGRTLLPIKEMGFDVVGIDINEDMVREAKKTGVEAHEMNACDLSFPDASFDTVFFPFHGIDYIFPDIYEAVKEAKRVLRPGGIFILSSHNRFYIKRLNQFFDGNYADQHGLITYRTTPLDWFRLKKYFEHVKTIQRISIAVSWAKANWKDKFYKLFPLLNKSTYFVCKKQ